MQSHDLQNLGLKIHVKSCDPDQYDYERLKFIQGQSLNLRCQSKKPNNLKSTTHTQQPLTLQRINLAYFAFAGSNFDRKVTQSI